MAEEDQPSVAVPPIPDAAPPRPGTVLRWLLFAAQLVVLAIAMFQVPSGHGFELGYYFGFIIIFGSIILWTVLYFATTTRNLLVFCLMALAQAGLIGAVGFHYQAEDRVMREVAADSERQKQAWAAKMAPFNMDPLYQMLDGEQPWTLDELEEMNVRAKGGQATLIELQPEMKQWEDQAVSRISKVSSRAALDFRRGLESRKAEGVEILNTIQALLSQDEELTGFLLERQAHYRVRNNTFEFDSSEDSQSCSDRIASISDLREKLGRLLKKAQEITEQNKPPR